MTEPYTDADIEHYAETLWNADGRLAPPLTRTWAELTAGHWPNIVRLYRGRARAILDALAANGRLLPAGGAGEEEWTLRYKINGQQREIDSTNHIFEDREDAERHIRTWIQHYPDLTYTDVEYHHRKVWYGPWQPADAQEPPR